MGRSVLAVCALGTLVALAACAATFDRDQQHYNAVDVTIDLTPPKYSNRKHGSFHNRFAEVGNPELPAPVPVNERFPSAVLFGRTCGGTILSDRWILSAAHCTLFTGGRDVLAGTNNSENDTGMRRRVKKLYIHPLFTVGPYWLDASRFGIKQVAARYDFLLAELEEPLILDGKTIVAASLDGPARLAPGSNVGYAGYGAEHHGETMRHDMHGMSLRILPDSECARLKEYNDNDMLCARGVPPYYDSACNGDSGSGLMLGNKIVGVTSWVENDAFECRNRSMVVFARVAIARDWIRDISGL